MKVNAVNGGNAVLLMQKRFFIKINQAKNVYMRPYMVLWHVLLSEVRKALHILGNLDKNYKWFNVFSQSFFPVLTTTVADPVWQLH